MAWWVWALVVLAGALVAVATYDLVQKQHAILRNFPVIGHLRFLLEAIGPELRQYIVTSNDDERPFSRDQRRWVYTSAKGLDTYFGFGTDNDLERTPGYVVIRHAAFPVPSPARSDIGYDPEHRIPAAKVAGGARGRAKAFRFESVVNISSMSYGSLSGAAVEALNRGAVLARCLQGTGEGGISDFHRRHGGDLIWQIGTGYFGCREPDGGFSLPRLVDTVAATPTVRGIEIKLSQGAKPGLGGLLPAAKVTDEIAAIRGIPKGVDCISPAAHRAFHDVDSMLEFVEVLADATGLPVGIKSAVGDEGFFVQLAERMAATGRGVDWITIDGGEGGTGAGPLTFTDHVSLPFTIGFSRVHRVFAERGLADDVVFIGSGRLGLPDRALLAFALGCDAVNVGREAMLAIGCIQAQRCHTGRCPVGVTSHDRWRVRGLDPASKSVRAANYVVELRKELLQLARACGVEHPGLVTLDQIAVLDDTFGHRSGREVFAYEPGWGVPSAADRETAVELIHRRRLEAGYENR